MGFEGQAGLAKNVSSTPLQKMLSLASTEMVCALALRQFSLSL
jgi:hypothetical protein